MGSMSQVAEKAAPIITWPLLRSSAIPSVEDAAHLIEDICRAVVPSGEGEVLAAFDLGEHLEMQMHIVLLSLLRQERPLLFL